MENIKQQLKLAIDKALETEKLFRFYLTNFKNKKLGFEDRFTLEIANYFDGGFAFPQYQIKRDENIEYLDLAIFNTNSSNYRSENIICGLEAKLYSPHQRKNLDSYVDFSLKGPNSDIKKLKTLGIKDKIILLQQVQIEKINGDLKTILHDFPIISYLLGDSQEAISDKLALTKGDSYIKKLRQALEKKDEDCVFGKKEKEIVFGENSITLSIHYFLV